MTARSVSAASTTAGSGSMHSISASKLADSTTRQSVSLVTAASAADIGEVSTVRAPESRRVKAISRALSSGFIGTTTAPARRMP